MRCGEDWIGGAMAQILPDVRARLLLDARRERVWRLSEDESRRPEDLGAVAQRAGGDAHRARRGRDAVALDRHPDGIEEDRPGRRQVAADDDELRVEDVDQHRQRTPDRLAGVGDRAPRAAVAGGDELEQRVARDTGLPMLRSSRAATATGLATVSRQPRLPQRQIGAGGIGEYMADLARDAADSLGTAGRRG